MHSMIAAPAAAAVGMNDTLLPGQTLSPASGSTPEIDLAAANALLGRGFTFDIDPASGSTITLDRQLDAVGIGGLSLTIDGNGATLEGAGLYNGLFVCAGNVTIDDLTIASATVSGGAGSDGGPNQGVCGFGGGRGGTGGPLSYGGGPGAGGDIFVQQGGSLVIEGGSLGSGTVSGGDAGTSTFGHNGTAGGGYGGDIFIEGTSQTISLAASGGQVLTIWGQIADQDGAYKSIGSSIPTGSSGDGTPYSGTGSLLLSGGGTIGLFASNTLPATRHRVGRRHDPGDFRRQCARLRLVDAGERHRATG